MAFRRFVHSPVLLIEKYRYGENRVANPNFEILVYEHLHNETISRNNLDEISQKKVQRNFAEFREISRK
jgi:hypothetical protein